MTDESIDVRLLEALAEIEKLLTDYHAPQAEHISLVRAAWAGPTTEFIGLIDSLEMWGGSGSVADLILPGDSSGIDREEVKADNERLRDLLIDVAAWMRAAGISNPRAQFWAEAFSSWKSIRAKP